MNSAVVIGRGYVGKATALAFGIEKFYTRSEANITIEEIAKCKYVFICLPTPTIKGKCFTDDIFKWIADINEFPDPNGRVFIIRSTVTPGFANEVMEKLKIANVVSNPEFLSEDTWEKDATQPQLIVVGANNGRYREMVKGLYLGRYKYTDMIETDNVTAELLKYALNSFFATKVIFANEIFDIAQQTGANYETIKLALQNHPWGSKNHFTIFYKGRRGVHGSCLPKDVENLSSYSPFFKMLLERNNYGA